MVNETQTDLSFSQILTNVESRQTTQQAWFDLDSFDGWFDGCPYLTFRIAQVGDKIL